MVKNEIRKTTLVSEFNKLLIHFGVQKLINDNMGEYANKDYIDLITSLCEISQQFGASLVIDKVYTTEL